MPTIVNNKIQYQGGEAMPALGTPEYATAFNDPQAFLKSEPTVISSNQGRTVLDQHVANHSQDMANIQNSQNAAPTTTPTPTEPKSPTKKNQAIEDIGGVTSDQASITGIDVKNGYTYDSNSGYFIPTAKTSNAQAQVEQKYADEERKVNDAFSGINGMYDTATQNLIASYRDLFAQRVADAKVMNNADSRNTNTLLMRIGANRTGNGGKILTATEDAGLERLKKISLDEADLIAKADMNLADKKYTAFIAQRAELTNLRKEKNDQIKGIVEAAYKAQKDEKDYRLEVQKFNEDTREFDIKADQAKSELDAKIKQGDYEFRDMKDQFGNTVGTQVFSKTTGRPISGVTNGPSNGSSDPLKGILNPVTNDANGVPNVEKQQAFLGTLPAAVRPTVQGLVNYQTDPKNLSMRGNTRTQLLSWAHQLDPNYDESMYPARSKFNTSWTAGGLASSNNAINTASQHLNELYKAGQALSQDNAGVFTLKWNEAKNWINMHRGDPRVTNFLTEFNLVAAEVAKAYKNGINSSAAPSGEEIEEMKNTIWSGSSTGQINGFVETTINMLGDKANVNQEQYTQTMGHPPRPIYMPTTMEKLGELKNNGLNINISGVNYTDPKAYVSSSPENKQTFQLWAKKLQALFPGRPISGDEIMQAINSIQ